MYSEAIRIEVREIDCARFRVVLAATQSISEEARLLGDGVLIDMDLFLLFPLANNDLDHRRANEAGLRHDKCLFRSL